MVGNKSTRMTLFAVGVASGIGLVTLYPSLEVAHASRGTILFTRYFYWLFVQSNMALRKIESDSWQVFFIFLSPLRLSFSLFFSHLSSGSPSLVPSA